MDDLGNEHEYGDDDMFQLTPKGCVALTLLKEQIDAERAMQLTDLIWNNLQAFCARVIKDEYPDTEYPAVVFDGDGGDIIGVNAFDIEDEL